MDLPFLLNLGKVTYDFAAAHAPLKIAGDMLAKTKPRADPAFLDLDAIGADPAWNADDLAPARPEPAK